MMEIWLNLVLKKPILYAKKQTFLLNTCMGYLRLNQTTKFRRAGIAGYDLTKFGMT